MLNEYPDIKSFAFVTEPAFQAFRNLTGKINLVMKLRK
jgi:hypothetical protein